MVSPSIPETLRRCRTGIRHIWKRSLAIVSLPLKQQLLPTILTHRWIPQTHE